MDCNFYDDSWFAKTFPLRKYKNPKIQVVKLSMFKTSRVNDKRFLSTTPLKKSAGKLEPKSIKQKILV